MDLKLALALGIFLAALVAGATAQEAKKEKKVRSKIIGGTAVQISALPYQVSIFNRNNGHYCGGTVIGPYTVLTAAHCVDGTSASSIGIRTGSTESNKGGVTNSISQIIKHPQYNKNTVDCDFAILYTRSPITQAQMLRLARTEPPPKSAVLVSGWGAEAETAQKASQYLRYTYLPTVDRSTCAATYAKLNKISTNMLCAGYAEGGKDACQGDSGGPLAYGNELVGVVSWGKGCGKAGNWGVFASVPAQYNWISSLIR